MKLRTLSRHLLPLGVLGLVFGILQAQQSKGTYTQVVNKATPGQNGLGGVILTSAPNPSLYQQNVTFTATMPSIPNGTTALTGTVQFFDGTTSLGTSTISGSTATFQISTLTVGTHPVTAQYSGDSNYNAATSKTDNQVVNPATASGLTLASTPNPSTFLQSVTFTATAPAGATGTFQFFDGTTSLGTSPIVGTTATLTTSTLSVGTHPVIAQYSGDSNFTSGTTNVDNQVVNKYASGGTAGFVTLASTPNPSTFLQPVTFTATFITLPVEPTGTVQFFDGTTLLGSGTISGTTATFTTSTLSVGSHPVTAVYGGDTNFATATSNIDNQVVNKYPSGSTAGFVTLASTPNPSTFLQSVTFTATFITLPVEPTGTVQFFDGTTLLGSGTISGTTATFTTSTLAVGTHPVTAVYGGDTNFATATSNADNQVVNKYPSGSTAGFVTLSSTPNPSSYLQSVTFTATFITLPVEPTGTVQFFDGTTLLGSGTISGTTATFTTSTLTVGTHPVTGVYGGDVNFATATSNVDNQVVKSAGVTVTVVGVPNPSTYTQTVTMTITVAPPTGGVTPTGTVTIDDGSTVLGTSTLNGSGVATFTVSTLAVGSHTINVTYNGDSNYQ